MKNIILLTIWPRTTLVLCIFFVFATNSFSRGPTFSKLESQLVKDRRVVSIRPGKDRSEKFWVKKNLPESVQFQLPKNEILLLRLALSYAEHKKGLGGVLKENLHPYKGMLFFNVTKLQHRFWMLDTYMNLDIFFLDENFKVIALERNLKAHPGPKNQTAIQRSKTILCMHVLEIPTSFQVAKKIKVGTTLKWVSLPRPSQIVSNIRRGL